MVVVFGSTGRLFRFGPLGAVAIAALAGCVGGEPAPAPAPTLEDPPGHRVLAELVLHLEPSRGRVRVERVPSAAAEPGAPGLGPQAITDVDLCQDGTPGSSDPTACGYPAGTPTVELVTDPSSLVDTYGTGAVNGCPASSFCAAVTLDSFWPRPLSNVYVQVTSITDDSGAPLGGHGGTNSDTAPASYKLANSLGLWQYTADAATTAGVVGMAPNNSGTRTWVFANPDDADTNVRLRVVASTTYTSYTMASAPPGSLGNACQGVSTPLPTEVVTSLPFPFTFYGATYGAGAPQQVTFSKFGVVTFGSTAGAGSGSNAPLPSSTGAPTPGLFVFWDKLDYGSGANATSMCSATVGTAPNRQLVIKWTAMNFASNVPKKDTPASMTFYAVLNEGSDRIDLVYASMTGPSSRAQGGSATVGAQNETGTSAAIGSTFKQAQYASDAWSLLPVP